MGKELLAEIDDLHKYFGATKAVDGISIKLYKGEICGLVGENGSGKSTMLSLLAGILKKDSGDIKFEGKKYAPRNLTEAASLGVSMIVQEANTIPGLTVADNMFLGMEERFVKCGIRDIKKMNAIAAEELGKIGLSGVNPAADVADYSMEQRKLIELVKAGYMNPKLLMIDETSTALSQTGRDELYKLMTGTRQKGNSVLLISHDLEEVLKFCDRIIIMRDGKLVGEVAAGEVDESSLKNMMVGRTVSEHYYREDYGTKISGKIALKVSNLSCGKYFENISFDLHEGEILGIGGLSESGMHELGKAIFGIEDGIKGDVIAANGDKLKSIKDSVKHKIGYISKNRDTESLFNATDITDNIAVTCMDKIREKGHISNSAMRKFAEEQMGLLNIKARGPEQIVGTLSGGNKQKVVLTKWIVRGTEVFIMDSPTRGIDVGVKGIIYTMLDDLRKQGKSLIVISEELLEVIGMCDRILVLKDGKINGEFMRDPKLSEEMLVQKMV